MQKMLNKLRMKNVENLKDLNINFNVFKSELKQQVLSDYLNDLFEMNKPIIEGESKKFFKHKEAELALVELKPTLYSFTFNRCGVVKGTDIPRLHIWDYLGYYINMQINQPQFNFIKQHKLALNDYFVMSDILTTITIEQTEYAVVIFHDAIPNIEIVWKNYLVGTMKHNLINCDKFKDKHNNIINYEDKLPNDIVRFDWRNPFENNEGKRCKDECIPTDYANFYINTTTAEVLCRETSRTIDIIFNKLNLKLVDICYFMDYPGITLTSEISPDCMRLKGQDGSSHDKDLWRMGKDAKTLMTTWTTLDRNLKQLVKTECKYI